MGQICFKFVILAQPLLEGAETLVVHPHNLAAAPADEVMVMGMLVQLVLDPALAEIG